MVSIKIKKLNVHVVLLLHLLVFVNNFKHTFYGILDLLKSSH